MVELAVLPVLDVVVEWQAGVFRQDKPALRAMRRRGVGGKENKAWWVLTKESANLCHCWGA